MSPSFPVARSNTTNKALTSLRHTGPDQLEGLPLDDLFNLVGHQQRQREDRDQSGRDRLQDGHRSDRRS